MIGRITGTLLGIEQQTALVDVGGVGYEIECPISTLCELPTVGETVTLLTHFVVREDAQLLFGFLTLDDRESFRILIKISVSDRSSPLVCYPAFQEKNWLRRSSVMTWQR